MPGYLTNRYVSYNPAADFAVAQAAAAQAQSEVDALEIIVAEAQGDIEDLQLGVGA